MKIGIVGLSQSGKSTLFNALTSTMSDLHAHSGKRDAHISIVKVPDARLDRLYELYPTAKKTNATIEYVDVGGLGKGATQRKGFQEQFLANLRNVDALCCILRCFKNEAVPHDEGSIDPARDWRIIEDEFLFSDMAILENRIERLSSEVKKLKDALKQKELEVLQKCSAALEEEKPIRELDLSDEEEKLIRGFQFLTQKPILLVFNIGEDEIDTEAELLQQNATIAEGKNRIPVVLSANLEMEIAQLPDDDKSVFQEEMGIVEPALNKMIRHCYDLLGLMSYCSFTCSIGVSFRLVPLCPGCAPRWLHAQG